MTRIALLILIMSALFIGCSSQRTPTPTLTLVPFTPTLLPTPTQTTAPTSTELPTAVPPTATPTPTPSVITGTVTGNLNVRQEASAAAKLLGKLATGDTVTLLARSADGKWFQVVYPPDSITNGWVLAAYVKPGSATDTLLALNSQGTPVSTGTAAATTAATATLTPGAVETTTLTAASTATLAIAPPTGSIIFDEWQSGQYLVEQVNVDGSGHRTLFSGASEPALSPNGGRLALHLRNGALGAGVAITSLAGAVQLVLDTDSHAGYPTWSPDGNNLSYHLTPANGLPGQVFRIGADGANRTLLGLGVRAAWQPGSGALVMFDGCSPNGANCGSLFTGRAFPPDVNNPTLIVRGTNPSWSPSGRQIAYQALDPNGNVNVFIANSDGSNVRQLTHGTHNDGLPIWSAGGQWIYYRSDQNGTGWAIYAIRMDGTGAHKVVDAAVNSTDWVYEKLAIGP